MSCATPHPEESSFEYIPLNARGEHQTVQKTKEPWLMP